MKHIECMVNIVPVQVLVFHRNAGEQRRPCSWVVSSFSSAARTRNMCCTTPRRTQPQAVAGPLAAGAAPSGRTGGARPLRGVPGAPRSVRCGDMSPVGHGEGVVMAGQVDAAPPVPAAAGIGGRGVRRPHNGPPRLPHGLVVPRTRNNTPLWQLRAVARCADTQRPNVRVSVVLGGDCAGRERGAEQPACPRNGPVVLRPNVRWRG